MAIKYKNYCFKNHACTKENLTGQEKSGCGTHVCTLYDVHAVVETLLGTFMNLLAL